MNFPSSVHLGGPGAVCERARQLLDEASPGDRFIFGVCEDMPDGGRETLVPLARTVYDHGQFVE